MASQNAITNERDPSEKFLTKLSQSIRDNDIIEKISRVNQYYDEPHSWFYSAKLKIKTKKQDVHTGSGISFFSQKQALIKCLSESIERYCNLYYDPQFTVVKSSYRDLIKNNYNALNPKIFQKFLTRQLCRKPYKMFRISENSIFGWTTCINLNNNQEYLIPSQLVYLSYLFSTGPRKESVINMPISTGCAGGLSFDSALLNGIYEIIERDSYMIFYLNKISAPKIILKKIESKKIRYLNEITRRYFLELNVFDISTDLHIPSIIAIIIDKSGYGNAVSVGLKANLNYEDAIVGAIEEAYKCKSWLRYLYTKLNGPQKKEYHYKNSLFLKKGLFWYDTKSIKKLNFCLKTTNTKTLSNNFSGLTIKSQLNYLKKIFSKQNIDVYYKDITLPQFRKINYYTIMSFIPQLQPLFLDDNYPQLGGFRLSSVPEKLGYQQLLPNQYNRNPHPFI